MKIGYIDRSIHRPLRRSPPFWCAEPI